MPITDNPGRLSTPPRRISSIASIVGASAGLLARRHCALAADARHPPDALLEIDHIIPVSEGGGNDESNLFTSCFNCNRGKGAAPLSSAPKTLAEKAEEIKEREAQLLGYREVVEARMERINDDMWRVAEVLVTGSSEAGMKRDWLRSIKTFNERLGLHVVLDAAELAYARKPYSERQRFLYFCGICWKKIRESAGEGERDTEDSRLGLENQV